MNKNDVTNDTIDNWDDEEDPCLKPHDTTNHTNPTKPFIDNEKVDQTSDESDDEWEKDDFVPGSTPVFVDTKLQSKAEIQRQEKSQAKSCPKNPPTDQEVEVKYPNGIIAKTEANSKRSNKIYTNDELERLEKIKKLKKTDLVIMSEHIGKTKPQENVQGSSINILKSELINKIIDSLDSLIKNNDYIKLSQNWNRSIFQNEILANIKKKNIFKFDDYMFNIKKTLETLDNISTYLSQRHPSNKITIITKNKKGSKIDDLVFTLYKYIVHILYNSSQNNIQDIFEILSLIKLLKQNDDITLKYISSNY